MWLINFRWFKQNCIHYECDYDFEKDKCGWEHGSKELLTVDPKTRKKHYYNPCKEKYCPVLQACKRGK